MFLFYTAVCVLGSSDFFGLNHYTSRYTTSGLEGPEPSLLRDSGTVSSFDPTWKTGKSPWLKVCSRCMYSR